MSNSKRERKITSVTIEQIENIRDIFKSVEVKRTYNASETVAMLKNDIIKLRKEGMTLSEIADILSKNNVHVSTQTIAAHAPLPAKTSTATDKTKTATQKTNAKPGAKTAAQQQNKAQQPQNKVVPKNPADGFEIDLYAADNI